MSNRVLVVALLVGAFFLLTRPGGALAQDGKPEDAKTPADGGQATKDDKAGEEERQSVTKHSVTIGGQRIDYSATAGVIRLKEEQGKPRADVFFIAYTRDGVDDLSKRPVMFTFNGGPGSSSVWLHMGAFGPRRVEMGDAGALRGPPWGVVENEWSALDVTDLVFIDPVSTGYSRASEDVSEKEFHGIQEDAQSVGEFIRMYTTRFGRWGSPKFLAGESYGTTRAAALAGRLQDSYGMYLNGVVLVSSILHFQTARFDDGNDLPYALFLPTYTATAWYHNRLPADLQQAGLGAAVAEAEAFASGDYLLSLFAGDSLSAAARQETAARLARLTGLSEEYVLRANLRIEISRFCKELLRGSRRTVGRLDSRFTGVDSDAAGERPEEDPSYSAILGPYSAAMNAYVRGELKFESDLSYEILTGRVRPWKYGPYENRYVDVASTLRGAMLQNPALRVFVANGRYDLATPFFATEHTFDHLGLNESMRANITMAHYEAGHMMYVHLPSLARLKEDLAAFIAEASAARTLPAP